MSRVLSVDPSSTILGWAILDEGDVLVAHGLISTMKVPYDHRYLHITNDLWDLLQKYQPSEVACERAFKAPGHNTAALQVAVMTLKHFCKKYKLPLRMYANNSWKASVAGAGNADKETVAICVRFLYPQLPEDVSDHITDAVAIGLHHLAMRHLENMVIKEVMSE